MPDQAPAYLTAPGPSPRQPGPAAVLRALAGALRQAGITRLYAAACTRYGVLSVTTGLLCGPMAACCGGAREAAGYPGLLPTLGEPPVSSSGLSVGRRPPGSCVPSSVSALAGTGVLCSFLGHWLRGRDLCSPAPSPVIGVVMYHRGFDLDLDFELALCSWLLPGRVPFCGVLPDLGPGLWG